MFKNIANGVFLGMGITIPFWMLLNNIAIILSLLSCSAYFFLYKNNRVWYSIYSAFAFLYLLMVLALLYTDNYKIGFQKLEQRLTFIVVPFVCFVFTKFITKDLIKMVLRGFVYSTLLAIVIFLFTAIKKTFYFASVNPFNEVNGNFFSYMEFTKVIEDTHPIYFGTYVLFSIFILGNDYFEKERILKIYPIIRFSFLLFLTVIIFLLNSFLLAGLFVVVFLYFFTVLIRSSNFSLFKKGFISCVFLSTMLLSSPFVYNKFKGINLKEDLTSRDFSGSQFTAVKARFAKFYCSIDLISNNFWIGVSPGDENTELMKYYKKNGFNHGVVKKFNSHNQYLTEFIYTGIFGFAGLIILFFILYKKGFKDKNHYLIAISTIFLVFNLTESALVRNKGIVFFVFFSCLLFNFKPTQKPLKP